MEIIKKLRQKGMTKYRIAKEVGVTWQTVNMWEKDVFIPKADKQSKLEALLKKEV